MIPRRLASAVENLLDGLHCDDQMMWIIRQGKKAVFLVEGCGLMVDCLDLDRPKSNVATDA
jgi:hypothetical protein